MTVYKMAYAKTQLASLIKEALAGQDVVIARGDQPLVRLVPAEGGQTSDTRIGGDLEGRVSLPDTFFAPMTDAEASDWGL